MLKNLLKEHLIREEEWGEYGHLIPLQNKRSGRTFSDEFIQQHGSQQYKDVIAKIKKYTGKDIIDPRQLSSLMFQSLNKIEQIEKTHIPHLEKMAVSMVKQDFNIPENKIEFDVKITKNVDVGRKITNIDIPDVTPEILSKFKSKESFDSNIKKRRLINALISGMSNKGQYMFHLADRELNKIDPNLINLYGTLTSLGDLGYFVVPDEYQKQFATSTGEVKGGEVRVDLSGKLPKIIARGRNFSILIHEIVKGIMDLMSLHGLPKDPEKVKHVTGQADYFGGEGQDLRYGPKLWEKFIELIPDDSIDLKSYIYNYVVSLKPNQFNELMNEIINGSEKGRRWMQSIANEVKEELK